MNEKDRKTMLENLLRVNISDRYAAACLIEIENGHLVQKPRDSGPTGMKEALHTYRIRARLARKRDSRIHGIDEMVDNLAKSNQEFVINHHIAGEKFEYFIFTDVACETLFGIVAKG